MSITVILTILQHRSVLLDKDATSQRDPTASISPGVGAGSDGGRSTESSTEDSAEGGHERGGNERAAPGGCGARTRRRLSGAHILNL